MEPTKRRATYCHLHPRDFANECDIARCESPEEEEEAEQEGYERLTWRELAEHVRWINDENAAWGSGNACGHITLKAIRTSNSYRWASTFFAEP